jgi:hypothetical protein
MLNTFSTVTTCWPQAPEIHPILMSMLCGSRQLPVSPELAADYEIEQAFGFVVCHELESSGSN